jgi:hypothetical protein
MNTASNFPEIETFIALPWNIAPELKRCLKAEFPKQVDIYKLLPGIELVR